jgi:hypothetical protein
VFCFNMMNDTYQDTDDAAVADTFDEQVEYSYS